MSEQEVRIVKLEPMRVASFHGFGTSPEDEAWKKMEAYAKAKGFFETMESEHRIFGFDNPTPSAGSPNYGYEFWITVGPETASEGEVEVKDVPGGTFAVLRWDGMGNPWETIPAAWQKLVLWNENNARYRMSRGQCLEEHLRPDHKTDNNFMLDLYMAVEE